MPSDKEKPYLFIVDSRSAYNLQHGLTSVMGEALETQAENAGFDTYSPLPVHASSSIETLEPDAIVAYVAEPALGASDLEHVYRALKRSRQLDIPYALVKDKRRFVNQFIMNSADVVFENNGPATAEEVAGWLTSLRSPEAVG